MNCKITRNAAKKIKQELEQAKDPGLMLRVFVTHSHGNHAHYGMDLDKAKDNDTIVETDKEISILLQSDEPMLDGIKIDYLYFPEEGFIITNPSKGNHGDH